MPASKKSSKSSQETNIEEQVMLAMQKFATKHGMPKDKKEKKRRDETPSEKSITIGGTENSIYPSSKLSQQYVRPNVLQTRSKGKNQAVQQWIPTTNTERMEVHTIYEYLRNSKYYRRMALDHTRSTAAKNCYQIW